MNLNVRGYFLLSQAVAKASMIPRRSGRILNVASIAGLAGNPVGMHTIAYNTSKGAVINFTRTLAGEWGRYGITVNAICPGFFPSKMTHGLLDKLGADHLASQAPLKRLGDDEDLKGLTLALSPAMQANTSQASGLPSMAASAPSWVVNKHLSHKEYTMTMNQQILLDNRPAGEASAANFKLVQTPIAALQEGQVLVRHHFLSLDPYMRGRMNDSKSYAAPTAFGRGDDWRHGR